MNIGLIIAASHSQNQQLQRWWDYYQPLVEHFDELMQQIRNEGTILAASDGSYLEGGQALTGWAFYAPRI